MPAGKPSVSSTTDALGDLSHAEIRAELKRILGHRDFEATERTRDFLRFVVEETLAGRVRQLKGYTIATKVFGRGKNFDAEHDPVVRIQAGRLRRALERYFLMAGRRDPVRIDMPKGRYAVRFTRQPLGRTRASDDQEVSLQPTRPFTGPTLSIQPLRNLSGDEGQLHFMNGIVEELVAALNRYRDVAAFPCLDPDPAGEVELNSIVSHGENGARFSLGGSVRRDASTTKVSLHLTDSSTGQLIWGDSWKTDLEAALLIETQEDIARSVVAAVAGEYGIIAQRLWRESRRKAPEELSSYEALLRYYRYMLVMTPSAGEEAFVSLERVTQREPDYGPAWSALANLFAHAFLFDHPGIEAPLERANEYARKGVSLDPGHQLSRAIMAYVHLLRGESDSFLTEAEAALALNPNSPNYRGTIGYLFCLYGDFERGRTLVREAIALAPRYPRWFHHGLYLCHFQRRHYERAFREAEKIGFQVGFWDPALKAAVLGKLGRLEEARKALEEVLELKPDFARRVRAILILGPGHADVVEDFMDGLRRAGLEIDQG